MNVSTSTCAVCGLAARSHCSRCQLVHYCGRDCQRTEWRTHKSQCKPAPAPAHSREFERSRVVATAASARRCVTARPASTYYLRPIAAGEGSGTMAIVIPSYGQCSNLGPRGCRLAQADMPLSCVAALACGKSQSADKNEAPVIWAATLGGQSSRNLRGRTVAATRRSASDTQPCGRKSCRQPLRWANSSCRCPSR